MGITITQPGQSARAAQAGAIIGAGERAKEKRARTERQQARAAAEQSRQKAQQMAMDWELQKMQMRSQQAFEREMRQHQYQLAAEDRAAAWQIEKAEMASRMDFEREEKERQRKLDLITTKKTALAKAVEDGQLSRNSLPYRIKKAELDRQYETAELGIAVHTPSKPIDVEKQAMTHLGRIDDVTTILSSFEENAIVNPPGWGKGERKHKVDLAVVDEDGNPIREATGSEKQLYTQAKQMMHQLSGRSSTISDTAQGVRTNPYPTPMTRSAYDALPAGSWYIPSSGGQPIQKQNKGI